RWRRAGLRARCRSGAARVSSTEAAAAESVEKKPLILPVVIPPDQDNVVLTVEQKEVRLTNLRKVFWPELQLTKGDLLQYSADVAAVLLPHIKSRAMVMKRYPHGAAGDFFFMKRAPAPRPSWIEICSIDHGSKGVIDFPMIQDH